MTTVPPSIFLAVAGAVLGLFGVLIKRTDPIAWAVVCLAFALLLR